MENHEIKRRLELLTEDSTEEVQIHGNQLEIKKPSIYNFQAIQQLRLDLQKEVNSNHNKLKSLL